MIGWLEGFEVAETYLAVGAAYVGLLVEAASVVCILAGLVAVVRILFRPRTGGRGLLFLQLRLAFSCWLALALEFQIAADILGTIVAPTFHQLGKLGIIVAIRIVLTYFLNKDLEADAKLKAKVSGVGAASEEEK
jgi:uncharacterized membrane protein